MPLFSDDTEGDPQVFQYFSGPVTAYENHSASQSLIDIHIDLQKLCIHIERQIDLGNRLRDLHKRLENHIQSHSKELDKINKNNTFTKSAKEPVPDKTKQPTEPRGCKRKRDSEKTEKSKDENITAQKACHKMRNQLNGFKTLGILAQEWYEKLEGRTALCTNMLELAQDWETINNPHFDENAFVHQTLEEMATGAEEMDQFDGVFDTLPGYLQDN